MKFYIVGIFLFFSLGFACQDNLIQNPEFKLNRNIKISYFDYKHYSSDKPISKYKWHSYNRYPAEHWYSGNPISVLSDYACFMPNKEYENMYFKRGGRSRLREVAPVLWVTSDDRRTYNGTKSNYDRISDVFLTNQLCSKVKKNRLYCFESSVYGLGPLIMKDMYLNVMKKMPNDLEEVLDNPKNNIAVLKDFGNAIINHEWVQYRHPVKWAHPGEYLMIGNFNLTDTIYLNLNDTMWMGRSIIENSVGEYEIVKLFEVRPNRVKFAIDNVKLYEISDSSDCTCDFKVNDHNLVPTSTKESVDFVVWMHALRQIAFVKKGSDLDIKTYLNNLDRLLERNVHNSIGQVEIITGTEGTDLNDLDMIRDYFVAMGIDDANIKTLYSNPYIGKEGLLNLSNITLDKDIVTSGMNIDFRTDQFKYGIVVLESIREESIYRSNGWFKK